VTVVLLRNRKRHHLRSHELAVHLLPRTLMTSQLLLLLDSAFSTRGGPVISVEISAFTTLHLRVKQPKRFVDAGRFSPVGEHSMDNSGILTPCARL
jgi:hypothetical protein